MNKSNFLNFLVDETLRLHEKSSPSFTDLERKLADYSISFLKGEFIPQIQMLRFDSPMGVLDVPINWRCFAFDQGQDYYWIKEDNDQEDFLKVLRSRWNPLLASLLIIQSDGHCYLIALKKADELYFNDLINPQEILIKAA